MTPEDLTAQLSASVQEFLPIAGRPNDNNLKRIKDTLYLILIARTYGAMNQTHNLWGVIATLEVYIRKTSASFPIPENPSPYPTINNNATNMVRAREEPEKKSLKVEYNLYKVAMRGKFNFLL